MLTARGSMEPLEQAIRTAKQKDIIVVKPTEGEGKPVKLRIARIGDVSLTTEDDRSFYVQTSRHPDGVEHLPGDELRTTKNKGALGRIIAVEAISREEATALGVAESKRLMDVERDPAGKSESENELVDDSQYPPEWQ
jgi:hypothetical protein